MNDMQNVEKMMGVVMIARGNIGCMTMLMEMEKKLDAKCYSMCMATLLQLDLFGSDAYLLWNNVCGRNVVATAELLFKLKVGAIPLHVLREDLAEHCLSPKLLQTQLPHARWMDNFSLDSVIMFGRDVLAAVPKKEGE